MLPCRLWVIGGGRRPIWVSNPSPPHETKQRCPAKPESIVNVYIANKRVTGRKKAPSILREERREAPNSLQSSQREDENLWGLRAPLLVPKDSISISHEKPWVTFNKEGEKSGISIKLWSHLLCSYYPEKPPL